MAKLRPYQSDLLNGALKAYADGYKAPCIVLPCGGGKSVILAEFARLKTEEDKRVMFLVHRKELCAQIFSTFVRSGVKMENCDIAMVQTVSRRISKERGEESAQKELSTELLPGVRPVVQTNNRHLTHQRSPDFIITDENHHSLAKTYKRIYKHFADVPRLGVTATPERLDGSGLRDTNDKLIIGVSARWLIENGYLSDYDYYAPLIDMPKFHVRHGDFVQSEMARFFEDNCTKIYGDVIAHYHRIADGKQAICYLPAVETSKLTAAKFSAAGITAAHIDGDTPKTERDLIIERFRRGDIKILCNVDIVSEGFDVPDCECVILLRPTQSLTLYIQQSMRCMRFKEGKRAIIIDHVNNVGRFGFPDKDREWLLDGHPKKHRDGEVPLKICPYCFAAAPISARECPKCGRKFEVEEKKTVHVDTELVKLDRESAAIRARSYISPNECETVEELKAYAEAHGYKPGWVYYQQKARGWLGGAKGRNTAAKRYPCRAVEGWDSKA